MPYRNVDMLATFINIPQLNSLDSALDVPLGILYVAEAFRRDGWEVRFVDLAFFPQNNWQEQIGFADLYGVTLMTPSYTAALRIRQLCKENNPKCVFVVGGPHPSALPSETLQDFDVVVTGEAESIVSEFRNVRRGIIAGKETQEYVLPARDLANLKQYHRKVGFGYATSIITSRGCPFSCSFCSSRKTFGSTRFYDGNLVLQEFINLQNVGFSNFVVYDDTFTLNRKRLYPLLESLRSLNVDFRCNGRTNINTLEDFQKLKAAGCHTISFGIESGSQRILDLANKKTTVAKNLQAVKLAKDSGLTTKIFLVVGLPGETWKSIEETKEFVERADPDCYTLFTFVPFPGTPVWHDPEKYGVRIVSKNWDDYYVIAGQNTGGVVVETTTYTSEQLASMREDLLQYLNSRPWRGTQEDYRTLLR